MLIFASGTALLGQADAREIIRRAIAADEVNWKVARNVILLEGLPYRRLVARDDRPLPPGEEKKEQEKLARGIEERREETGARRAERLAEYARRRDWQREAWRELPEAFDFRLAAEEVWAGIGLYVIEAIPRRGYQPRSRTGKVLANLKGKLWVAKQDYRGESGGGSCRESRWGCSWSVWLRARARLLSRLV